MKLPAFQFYPGDWRKDPGVQALSYHDRGVWFEILCLMHESTPRGKLVLNGHAMPDDALARLLGIDEVRLTSTLTTLLTYGVAARDPETGALMSRRMVRDDDLRKGRVEAGKKGGNPALVNHLVNPQVNQKPTTHLNQKPTPSSSSSSSDHIAPASADAPNELKLEDEPTPRKTLRQRDILFDALAAINGSDPTALTKRYEKACGVAIAEIKAATPDVTPEEIGRRAINYRAHMPNVTLTPSALATHWAMCATTPKRIVQRQRQSIPEPRDWKSWLNHEHPDSRYSANQPDEAHQWSDLDEPTQRWIVSELKKANPT